MFSTKNTSTKCFMYSRNLYISTESITW